MPQVKLYLRTRRAANQRLTVECLHTPAYLPTAKLSNPFESGTCGFLGTLGQAPRADGSASDPTMRRPCAGGLAGPRPAKSSRQRSQERRFKG
jgi:hypothetical protein